MIDFFIGVIIGFAAHAATLPPVGPENVTTEIKTEYCNHCIHKLDLVDTPLGIRRVLELSPKFRDVIVEDDVLNISYTFEDLDIVESKLESGCFYQIKKTITLKKNGRK